MTDRERAIRDLEIRIRCTKATQRRLERKGLVWQATGQANHVEQLETELAALKADHPPGPKCPHCGHRPD